MASASGLDGLLVEDAGALLCELRPGQRPGVLIVPRGERLSSGRARRPRTTTASAVVGAAGGDRHEATMVASDRLGRALAYLAASDRGGRL